MKARVRIETRRMHLTAPLRPPHTPSADQTPPAAEPGVGAGATIAFEYVPIGPFLLLAALAILAFIPAFAALALVAVAAAVLALPFLLVRHLLGRG